MPEKTAGNNDIIAALATPPGSGAISVVRISGDGCLEYAEKFFKGKTSLRNSKSHRIYYGNFLTENDETIDDVLVSVFINPNSYTGEDSVEISFHGNQLIADKILKRLVELNIRLAEPGEFTKRAFLNGKIDLTQAEAVADVISSRTENSLKGARNQLNGALSKKIDFLRQELINAISLIELELDFAEEDLEFISRDQIIDKIKLVQLEINKLIDSYNYGKIIKEGVNLTLVGQTNVGKSSLLNLILKESRAIVSHIAGTTRDVIREEISINGILYKIYDTAGIRLTDEIIEKEGIERSINTIKMADIVLFIYDLTIGIDESLLNEVYSLTEKERVIIVGNKKDLVKTSKNSTIDISAKTSEGIESLFEAIKSKTISKEIYTESDSIVTNIRHKDSLVKCKINLLAALESINNNMSGEYVSVDLRSAVSSLSEVIGKVTSEDILNNIFSSFCIGK